VVKNQVRPTGLLALGLPCHLMGTGMAFPWECIHSAQLATGHIVEDMQLGLELARRGEPPRFCPDVRVTSSFPRTEEGIRTQRTRWEHGHLGVIFSHAPQLLRVGLRRFDARAVALALDLIVPPLALFVMLACMNALLDAAFTLFHGSTAPLLVGSIALGLVALSVIFSWIRYGRHIISFATLATAPVYAVRKIPVYVSFLWSRQLDWVRSKRDS
jgi:cellulose synthase/poly-beta-1,6-N-acetylglucosamine synthase-like glycosyltransferase